MITETIGVIAGRSGDTITDELHKCGYKVALIVGNDKEPGADIADFTLVKDLREKQEILDYLNNQSVENVLIATGHIFAIELAEYLKLNGFNISIDLKITRLCKDKYKFKQHIEKLNYKTPKYILLDRKIDKKPILDSTIEYIGMPCVVKAITDVIAPQKIYNIDDLTKVVGNIYDLNSDVMLEEYIDGNDCTVPVVNSIDEIKDLGVLYWTKGKEENLVGFEDARSNKMNEELEERICTMSRNLVKDVGIPGFSRVDYIVKDNNIYILEVNSIIVSGNTGSTYNLKMMAAGINRAKYIVKCALEKFYNDEIDTRYHRRNKILFVSYGGGHINTLIPLIKKIKKDDNFQYEVLGLNTARNSLIENNIKFSKISDLVDKEAIDRGENIARKYHTEGLGIDYEDTVAYYGGGLRDLINEIGTENAYRQFELNGRKAFNPVETMKKIILKLNPDIIITTDSPRYEKATLIAGSSLGIPSIRIQQFFSSSNINLPKDIIHCVINTKEKDKLIKQGIKQKKIIVTGQPTLDNIIDFKGRNIATQTKLSLGLDNEEKVIVYATQKTDDNLKILSKILDIGKKYDDFKIIIKIHPNEKEDIYIKTLKEIKSDAIIIKSRLYDVLSVADVVITEFSTVGLETIYFDKPLVTVNLTSDPDKAPYVENGVAIGVDDIDDLEASINTVLYNDSIRCELQHSRKEYKNSSKATDKIFDLVTEILN